MLQHLGDAIMRENLTKKTRDYLFSTYVNLPEKQIFLTRNSHTQVCVLGAMKC